MEGSLAVVEDLTQILAESRGSDVVQLDVGGLYSQIKQLLVGQVLVDQSADSHLKSWQFVLLLFLFLSYHLGPRFIGGVLDQDGILKDIVYLPEVVFEEEPDDSLIPLLAAVNATQIRLYR